MGAGRGKRAGGKMGLGSPRSKGEGGGGVWFFGRNLEVDRVRSVREQIKMDVLNNFGQI